ncbi:MAG: hypothetical protein WB586_03925 [Chthoniobacterales bacterium]
MKFLFVSPEQVIRQRYRRGLVFRLAAVLVFLGLIAQVPIFVFGVLAWTGFSTESKRQKVLLERVESLREQNSPLNEVRQDLSQILQWEPIFRSRIPVSALLSAIENSIPANAVLDSISIESDQYDKTPVPGGIYRVPINYRVVIQGLEKIGVDDTAQLFADALQKRLPSASELVRSERLQKRSDDLIPFLLEYSVKPTGNYFGLGLKKIAEPDSL